jgi:uncharacterized protein YegP (UPF0339 family)
MNIIQAIKDFCGPPPSPVDAHFYYWKAADKDFRWHLKAGNGEIVASGEGYVSKQGVLRGISAVRRAAAIADSVERGD